MIVKTDVALVTMIQNKDLYLGLIDHMDSVAEGDEVRTVMYQQKLGALLDEKWPLPKTRVIRDLPAERRKLEGALCIENLHRAGLVTHVDAGRGVMVFAPFVIEMFRHFDNARLRHLTSSDYEIVRKTFNDLFDAFGTLPSLSPSDIDFKEHVQTLRKEIRGATAKMKECVGALQGCLQRLGEIVDQADYTEVDAVHKAREALSEINTIYMRNILPALQFLDEKTDIKGGMPALAALTGIGDMLDRGGQHSKLVTMIYYAAESIRSYRHDISVISTSMMRYVQQSEAHRLAHDKIESAWNRLYEAARELQDGSLKDNTLSSSHPALASIKTFSGIKVRGFEAKVQWPDESHRLLLIEHLRTTLPQVTVSSGAIYQLEGAVNDIGEVKRQSDARLLALGALIDQWPLRALVDTHAALHEHLATNVEDYELCDLLMSLEWLKKREGLALTPAFDLGTIETERERLHYYRLQMEPLADD